MPLTSTCAILLPDGRTPDNARPPLLGFFTHMTDRLRRFTDLLDAPDDDDTSAAAFDADAPEEEDAREPADAAPRSRAAAHADVDESIVLAAVRRVLDGDTEAFAVILHAYERLVAATLARCLPANDVQEVAQDAFLRAYRALPGFRHDAPFRAWILKIARLAAMDHWRRRYRRRDIVMSDFDESGSIGVEHAAQAVQSRLDDDARRRDDARRLLAAAMERLSPDDRAVLNLVELEEVPMAEAAKQLGCGLSAVKVRAFRARKRLKRHVEDILAEFNRQPQENTP